MKPTLPPPRLASPSDDRILPGELPPTGSEAPTEAAVPSSRLLRGRKSVQIEHNGALYQLRATKFGKLILTK
jgi:hemin uptake protein HemP